MKRYRRTMLIKRVLEMDKELEDIIIKGWIRTRRDSKAFSFLEVNDGSTLSNLQVIVENHTPGYEDIKNMTTGASIEIRGNLVRSPGKGQKWELRALEVILLGEADPLIYPLQKKRHSDEFLRKIAHLRPRTNKYSALNRIRSRCAYLIHTFFQERDFFYVHTPLLTSLDCEGAGELFRVVPAGKKRDFFDRDCYLTVSGQLTAEALCMGLGRVYTFGPTFRAEDSNTPRHAAEFWMVEPEMAFFDLEDNMDLAEDLLRWICTRIREECWQDISLFARFLDKGVFKRLDTVEKDFVRIEYRDVIDILEKAHKKVPFEYPPQWGEDIHTEYERFLTERYFKGPVIVYNYPSKIKPFYMKENPDGITVAAMDILLPQVGEVIGGSQREEDLNKLLFTMKKMGISTEEYNWYIDLRRFGTVVHSGFGLGFERLLMFITGISNIRDVIPFPRTPGRLAF